MRSHLRIVRCFVVCSFLAKISLLTSLHVGSINTHTNRNVLTGTIGSGHRKATSQSYLAPHLGWTSTRMMWTIFSMGKLLRIWIIGVWWNCHLLGEQPFAIKCYSPPFGSSSQCEVNLLKSQAKIKSAICNYLWSGKEQLTQTRVSWR